MTQLHTCGGGRPPAPAGHTGSMVSLLGVLHWQSGDGLREVHSGPASISIRTGLIRGISHSVVMLWHGKSLPVEYIYLVRKTNSIEGNMINICVGDLLQWLIHHATCPKARLVQQDLTKVSHLSIHRTLIAAMVKSENDNEHFKSIGIVLIWLIWRIFSLVTLCPFCPPEEGVLSPIHPGTEGQTWILSERWNDQSERQCHKNKTGWQHNLPKT